MVQFIETAQDMHIQNYLGTQLYKKLQSLIVSGEIDDAGNEAYRELLSDYIKPMLAWYTQSEYIPFAAYTMSNGGIFKHRSENSDEISREEIAGLASRANDKALFYTDRFLNYICANKSDFSEYNESTDDMSPDKDISSFGWFLG